MSTPDPANAPAPATLDDSDLPASTGSSGALEGLANALDDVAAQLPVEQATDAAQAQQLYQTVQALGGTARQLRLQALQGLLLDAQVPLADIQAATQQAQGVIRRLAVLQHRLLLAGDVLMLGTVLAQQQWPLLLPALKALRNELNAGP